MNKLWYLATNKQYKQIPTILKKSAKSWYQPAPSPPNLTSS